MTVSGVTFGVNVWETYVAVEVKTGVAGRLVGARFECRFGGGGGSSIFEGIYEGIIIHELPPGLQNCSVPLTVTSDVL